MNQWLKQPKVSHEKQENNYIFSISVVCFLVKSVKHLEVWTAVFFFKKTARNLKWKKKFGCAIQNNSELAGVASRSHWRLYLLESIIWLC